MKFKITEKWKSPHDLIIHEGIDFVDIGRKIVYYARDTRFCSVKAAEKFMNTWKPIYAEEDAWRNTDHPCYTLQDENRRTQEVGFGFIYEVVPE